MSNVYYIIEIINIKSLEQDIIKIFHHLKDLSMQELEVYCNTLHHPLVINAAIGELCDMQNQEYQQPIQNIINALREKHKQKSLELINRDISKISHAMLSFAIYLYSIRLESKDQFDRLCNGIAKTDFANMDRHKLANVDILCFNRVLVSLSEESSDINPTVRTILGAYAMLLINY